MKSESLVLAVAGMCFGVIVGWVLANLEINRQVAVQRPAAQAAAPTNERQPPPLDEARVQQLTTILKNDPANAGAAVQLATTYFDAQRFDDAIKWYQEGLRLDPKNADAGAQLGLTYFFTRGTDSALEEFDRSLKIDPNHPRTLLNKGIVLWRGKQDLEGAAELWRKVVKLAPNSPEAEMAQQGLMAISGGRGGGEATPTSNQ
jgi:cytochrome c-type biogenesis protein CcmH/NrfG